MSWNNRRLKKTCSEAEDVRDTDSVKCRGLLDVARVASGKARCSAQAMYTCTPLGTS